MTVAAGIGHAIEQVQTLLHVAGPNFVASAVNPLDIRRTETLDAPRGENDRSKFDAAAVEANAERGHERDGPQCCERAPCRRVTRCISFSHGESRGCSRQVSGWRRPPCAPVFDAPSPTGLTGCWVDAEIEQTDLYGSSFGAPSATTAPKDGHVSATLSIPITLTNVATYLRYVVTVLEADTRIGESQNGVAWSSTNDETIGNICPPDDPTNGDCLGDCYDFSFTRPAASVPSEFSFSLSGAARMERA
jgi:hypothetical protein